MTRFLARGIEALHQAHKIFFHMRVPRSAGNCRVKSGQTAIQLRHGDMCNCGRDPDDISHCHRLVQGPNTACRKSKIIRKALPYERERSEAWFQWNRLAALHLASSTAIYRVNTLQTEKNPWFFQTKLQAICRTNAHLLIQILCEHHVWKINYSRNTIQVSYMIIWERENSEEVHLKISCNYFYHTAVRLPAFCCAATITFSRLHKFPTFPWFRALFPDFSWP